MTSSDKQKKANHSFLNLNDSGYSAYSERVQSDFFQQDALEVAPELIGKNLIRQFDNKTAAKFRITEIEIYRGEEDLACHASRGRTKRTSVMYENGGLVYVYLIYGMYWMLNFVTGSKDHPQAILIRGITGYDGPGKLTRHLQIDKSFYGEDLSVSERIWVENDSYEAYYMNYPRVGVDYAGEIWKNKPWRYKLCI